MAEALGEFLAGFGRRVRQQRERLGLSQRELADALQVSPQAVSKWERGENGPELVQLPNLASLLDLSLDELLGANPVVGDFEATVLITSLRGFTERARALRPADVQSQQNANLQLVGDAIARFGGVLLKYLGEGALAFFSGPGHRDRGVQAAMAARRASPSEFAAGLAAGSVHLSTIGHPSLLTRDLAGSAVSLAFRVHQWAQERPGGLGIDNSVANGLSVTTGLSSHHDVLLKGFDVPMTLWEIPS
jgi:class 3 adenylate cyclase